MTRTTRSNVGNAKGVHMGRDYINNDKLPDREHCDAYKTWGCKAYEHKSGRKWLHSRKCYLRKQTRTKLRKYSNDMLEEHVIDGVYPLL